MGSGSYGPQYRSYGGLGIDQTIYGVFLEALWWLGEFVILNSLDLKRKGSCCSHTEQMVFYQCKSNRKLYESLRKMKSIYADIMG